MSAKSAVSLWRCICDCGGERITPASPLIWGRTTSCGCNRYASKNRRHGFSGNAHKGVKPNTTYTVWRSMRVRCSEPKAQSYPRYGGRGVTVCDRWQSFENFLADMGECPHGLTLDRINNEGNYELTNCRWATRKEQQTNRAMTRWLAYNGRKYCLADLARLAGCSDEVLRSRLKAGWPITRAVETPVRAKRPAALPRKLPS